MTKREHNTIIYDDVYKGFKLYSDPLKSFEGFYLKVLDKTITGLEELLSNHNKINIIRFELYFKNNEGQYIEANDDTNKLVSKFFKKLKERLLVWEEYKKEKGQYEKESIKRVLYQSVREQSQEKHVHYHCLIAFRALSQWGKAGFWNEYEDDYDWIYKLINDTWREVCPYGIAHFGTPGYCSHYYYIDRNAPDFMERMEDCIRGFSYLAKVYSKDIDIKHSKKFTSSTKMKRGGTDIKLVGSYNEEQKETEAA